MRRLLVLCAIALSAGTTGGRELHARASGDRSGVAESEVGRSADVASAQEFLAGRPFGVVEDLAWDSTSDLDPLIERMVESGVQIVRMDFRWSMIEPAKDQWVFETHDRIVSALRSHNIEVLGILEDAPTWANGQSGDWSGTFPPSDDADWADYVEHVATHYKSQVGYWELWNEENLQQFFRPAPDAAGYVRLLKSGFAAVRRSDPSALVVLGGLGGNGVDMGWEPPESKDFLQKIYDAGGGGSFDVVAIHPYVHPVTAGITELERFVGDTLAVISRNGDAAKPLWLTEIGWSTTADAFGGPTVTETDVANWVKTVYSEGPLVGAQRIFWYNFRDTGSDPTNVENNFGLLRRDLICI